MLTRQQFIDRGKVWTVYPDCCPEKVEFEGSKTAAMAYIRQQHGMRAYKTGKVRLARLIFEIEE